MWLRWFPWKTLVSRLARARGLVDPVKVLSHLESLAQPIEVKEPLELLRAGLVFHARGILNTGVIQHNLDWVWPYWVERQYDPHDEAFIPRAFSISHINLTHRNWTAVGMPDLDALPIVDPRGLVTPFWDSWSLDTWVVAEDGRRLFPSRLEGVEQYLELHPAPEIVTLSAQDGLELSARLGVVDEGGVPICRLRVSGKSDAPAWLVVALRPYNPEGVSFVHDIALEAGGSGWSAQGRRVVNFSVPAERWVFSDYGRGDVQARLFGTSTEQGVRCRVGMATAAAMFELPADQMRSVEASVPLEPQGRRRVRPSRRPTWDEALRGSAQLRVPEPRFQFLYEAAVRSLILHTPGVVYAGPYTYNRFWFRDAAFILHALLCVGLADRVERALGQFPSRQRRSGYFHSQDGEWDSNGEALWILGRYCALSGRRLGPEWRRTILRAGRWIKRQRVADTPDAPHAGLLPAGFSAEHLGPNDYYYWDDFWAVAGLNAAAELLEGFGDNLAAEEFREEGDRLFEAIERSLARASTRLGRPAMPASPYRRLDSGAIGCVVASYPLQLFLPLDSRMVDTLGYLLDDCFVHGGFFLDLIHSGINPYLTLHVAQALLRAADLRCLEVVRTVADLASPTGQWPEAIHPRTRGGCMGDGHHAWASAEWVMMVRNAFVREEGDRIILASGILPEWLEQSERLSFGPAPTRSGDVTVSIEPRGDTVEVGWEGRWRELPPVLEVRLPGFESVFPAGGQTSVVLERVAAI